jgi:hypothetical protein
MCYKLLFAKGLDVTALPYARATVGKGEPAPDHIVRVGELN